MRPFDELPEKSQAEVQRFAESLAARGVPRRVDRQRWSEAELAIQHAVDVVEVMGADPRLTDAVVLLAEAKRRVAAFIDGAPVDTPNLHESEG